MTKTSDEYRHKRIDSQWQDTYNPIKRDQELNSLMNQWVQGKISYSEMKDLHQHPNQDKDRKIHTK